MINKRTICGVILCAAGIVTARAHYFFSFDEKVIYLFHSIGIIISFSGVALFASGLKTRVIEKIRLCPYCYHKNPAGTDSCNKCKKEISFHIKKDSGDE